MARPIDLSRNAVADKCGRVTELRDLNRSDWESRRTIKAVMDGGRDAVVALLGQFVDDEEYLLPIANMIMIANQTLGQKLGRVPTLKVEPPNESDVQAARDRADKVRRIVAGYDANDKLHMMMPQIGRWLPGYAISPIVIQAGRNRNGEPTPARTLRDPYDTLLGSWGIRQQPEDIAFIRRIDAERLKRMYPEHADKVEKIKPKPGRSGRILSSSTKGNWEHQGRDGIEVYEYLDAQGSWWLLPELNLLLNFVPNPLASGPAFHIGKRFAFSALVGMYDQALGAMAYQARLALLMIVAAEDSTFSPTNIVGDLMADSYNVGRNAVNFFAPGSQVMKTGDRVDFSVFQQMTNLSREVRQATRHPVSEDGISPNSFVTGRGLEELSGALDNEVREYQTIQADMLMETDAMMLEFDEEAFANRQRSIHGLDRSTPFRETYVPAKHIAGERITRRVFGAMAGLDEPTKISVMLNLLQADLMDPDTAMENVDGFENLPKMKERIRATKAERVLFAIAEQMGTQGDPKAISMLLTLMPKGELRDELEALFGTPEEQAADAQAQAAMAEQEAMAQALSGLTGGAGGPGGPDQTQLARLTTTGAGAGNALLGSQVVAGGQ